jgi:hypothetical protein
MAPCVLEIELTAVDNQDATRFGLSALPNAAAEASGGLVTRGTGTGQLSVSSGAVTVGTNNDKTGYTASTVSDKTGYSLSSTQTFNVTGSITGNLSGSVGSVSGSVGSVTGDVGGNVTGSVGSVATGGITTASFASGAINAAAIATDAIGSAELAATAAAEIAAAVVDLSLSGHTTSGTVGEAISNASSAGDPWSTAVPGAYSAGQAGYILGTNVNATVSSRASQTSVDTVDDFLDTEIAAIKAKTDNLPAAPAATGDAMTLTSGERNSVADALLDRSAGIETGYTPRQSLRIMLAALAGKLSGAATTTVTIRNAPDTKARITATVDEDGNRSAITLDGT